MRPFPRAAVTPKRNTGLDFARGCAILMVMGYHFRSAETRSPFWNLVTSPFHRFGATGVDLFFVLSGFVVGGLLMQEYRKKGAINVRKFLARRAMKILPAYYVFILAEAVTRHFPLRTFFWQNLLQVQNYAGTSISHTWTLSIEVHFYILLALAMGFMAWRRFSPAQLLAALGGIALAVTLVRIVTIALGHPGPARIATHNRLDALLCGVLLAVLSCFYPERFERLLNRVWPLLFLAAGLLIFLVLVYPANMGIPRPGWGYVGFTILDVGYSAVILLLLRFAEPMRRWPLYGTVAWIGTYSYGIYLWHNAVRGPSVALSGHMPQTLRWPALMALQYGGAILLGVVMTRLVEWPVLRLRERLLPQAEVRSVAYLAAVPAHADGHPLTTERAVA